MYRGWLCCSCCWMALIDCDICGKFFLIFNILEYSAITFSAVCFLGFVLFFVSNFISGLVFKFWWYCLFNDCHFAMKFDCYDQFNLIVTTGLVVMWYDLQFICDFQNCHYWNMFFWYFVALDLWRHSRGCIIIKKLLMEERVTHLGL